MNDHSGPFPQSGAISPANQGATVPSTGLRQIVQAPARTQQVNLSDIWRVLVKWWWLIAGVVIASVLVAILISLLIQPMYRAGATLEVNPQGVQPIQMGELQPMQIQDRDFINTQAGLMRSRALAERVGRSLNLAADPSFLDPSFEGDRSAAVADALEASVTVTPIRDSRLIELSVENPSPELAARIANDYAETFIRMSLERRYEANSYARTFLEQRIGTVRGRLETSERQLVAYAQQQGIVTLNVDSGSGGSRIEQPVEAQSLVALNQALQEARSARIAAEQRFRQTQATGISTEMLSNQTVQVLSAQRATLEAEYQEKLGLFQPNYPQMVQLRARIAALDNAIRQQTRAVSGTLRNEFEAARAREAALEARVDGLRSSLMSLRGRSIQYTILQREVDTNRALYDALLQRYKEVGVAGGVGVNAVSVVDRAQVPGAPFQPNLPLNLIFGLLGGLILGLGSAFALEWLDDTIKTPDDLLSKLGIAPLGIIPAVGKDDTVQNQLEDTRSQITEAYQSVRTALQFSTEHGVPRTLLVTSTRSGEGKSTSVLSIARSIAGLGASVLLIDADLRKPTFRGPSGNSEGLSNLLSGSDDLEKAIHPTELNGLSLLPAGKIPPNPAELLAAGRFEWVIERASQMFDYVVVDGPPVLGLADAPLLASQCEGTMIVIEAGAIRRAAALNTVTRLRDVNAHIMGGVLTKFSATKSGYGYGYGYGYGDDRYAYREGDVPKRQIQLLKST